MIDIPHNTNRSLIRIFCLSLSGLLLVYAAIAAYGLSRLRASMRRNLRPACSGSCLGWLRSGVLFRWGWFDEPLESQIGLMGASFEADYAALSTKTKIRLIVLVTMLSLLLELVLIRWLASVFPVYSFYKNFTMLACFLGLGAGYAVAEKQPCAPAMVLPMLALFVGVITLLRYDTGAGVSDILGRLAQHVRPAGLLPARRELHHLRLHLLSGGPALRQIAAQLEFAERLQLQSGRQHSRRHRAVRDEPVLAAAGDLVRRDRRHHAAVRAVARRFPPLGIASFCVLLAILAWPVQPETQRIYSPYQLLERAAKPDGLMQILSGGSYYQKVYNFADSRRGAGVRRGSLCSRLLRISVQFQERRRSASPSSAPAAAMMRRPRCGWARPMSMPSRSIRPSRFSAPNIIPSVRTTIPASTCRSTTRAISSAPPTSNMT